MRNAIHHVQGTYWCEAEVTSSLEPSIFFLFHATRPSLLNMETFSSVPSVPKRFLTESFILLEKILFQDTCNRRSNQNHLGTIQCGGLRAETVQYCSKDEIAACFMASMPVNSFVTAERTFDYTKLHKVVLF